MSKNFPSALSERKVAAYYAEQAAISLGTCTLLEGTFLASYPTFPYIYSNRFIYN